MVTESGTESGFIRLYALPPNDDMPMSVTPEDRQHTRFVLPELKFQHTAILSAHSGAHVKSQSVFAPADAVLLLFVTVLRPSGRVAAELSYAINTSTFMNNLPHDGPHNPDQSAIPSVHELAWAEWGPENSRLLPYMTDSIFAARCVPHTINVRDLA